jgi:DNA (cytosine-5)-methyltransferase 1
MIDTNEKIFENYTFIDLFAGIGGFHLALSSFGAKCVFASEWDKHATETYEQNFRLKPFGDITKISENDIPKHDILCGGFPCQAFSVSGKQKGFEDIRGTLFFDIARIVKEHLPKVLFLENVKNLAKHDEGKTLKTIIKTLEELNYSVYTKIFNASNFGLPQNRERIYIVAFNNNFDSKSFQFPVPSNEPICLNDILEDNPENAKVIERTDIEIYKTYTQTNSLFGEIQLLNKPIQIGKVNKGGQGERIYHPLGHAITLSAYGGGVGSKTGLYLVNGQIRKLSPRECARVQGFPDSYILNKINTQSYKQFGNSVSLNVLQNILIEIAKTLKNNE